MYLIGSSFLCIISNVVKKQKREYCIATYGLDFFMIEVGGGLVDSDYS